MLARQLPRHHTSRGGWPPHSEISNDHHCPFASPGHTTMGSGLGGLGRGKAWMWLGQRAQQPHKWLLHVGALHRYHTHSIDTCGPTCSPCMAAIGCVRTLDLSLPHWHPCCPKTSMGALLRSSTYSMVVLRVSFSVQLNTLAPALFPAVLSHSAVVQLSTTHWPLPPTGKWALEAQYSAWNVV